jgi:AmmeMemoRadiSam system protein B
MVLKDTEIMSFIRLILILCLSVLCVKPAFARDYYYSSFSDQPERYTDAINNYKSTQHNIYETDGEIKAGILPHHLLAEWMIVDFFETLAANKTPKRIILIGPDHFAKGINHISVALLPWKTPFGYIYPDTDIANELEQNLNLKRDIEVFSSEHSVGNIIPFISYYFPKAQIVPILVQKNIPDYQIQELRLLLTKYAQDKDTVIILSMDFTHHKTASEEDKLDEISRKVIFNLDYSKTEKLNMDCPDGLSFVLYTASMASMQPHIRYHSNAARILNNPNLKDVTSYHTIFFVQ